MKIEKITSASNPKIRELLALMEKSRARREKRLFVVEGRRETRHCLEAGFIPRAIFYSPEITGGTPEDLLELIPEEAAGNTALFETSPSAYSKIAYREGTEGIVCEMHAKDDRGLSRLETGEHPLVVVLESVEKPGNIGAVLRSAEACGADALIVCDPKCDLYNPNLIRASIGAAFRVPTVACSSGEAIAWLKEKGIRILTAQLQDSEPYYDTDMKTGCAIVLGSEDKGLGHAWRNAADCHIRIPMLGRLDSLNVSVSAAILLYEAVRQRIGTKTL